MAEVVQKTVPIYSEYIAQTDARETVEIRARVQAFLDAQHYTEGTVVKKDQLLFTLDKREYEAKLQQAKSELEMASAKLGKAETDERRLKPLAAQQAVPQQDYDNAAAESAFRPSGSLGCAIERRRDRAGLELLHDPLSDRGPDRQAPGGPREPRRQGRGHAARHRVEHRSDPRQPHDQRDGLPAFHGKQEGARRYLPYRWI